MDFEILVQVAEIIVSVVAVGGGVVAVTQFIKNKLGLVDGRAMALFAIVATLFAVLEMLVARTLIPDALTLDQLSETLPLIILGAQGIYRQFVAEK